ncbi:hypothetical protein TM4_7 [Mycobacterium phage TM4]|uniref:Uncharacterized protein n=1 Tax=Mycobacterium phage TM4 TaxID=88870 RepID=Q9ZX70_BPMT4|nr:hypothetical protein TM4_gp7 [Mycobacterium phage TM4]AAD17575.1 hypothetical protein TM4_7 [Mycobacterium phage TM4]AGK85754.1 hypothetical protein 33D_0072 [Mycobacterium phage 33D]
MSDNSELIAARDEGRSAPVGAVNPYAGQGIKARLWRLGYRTMLLDMLNNSPAVRAYLQAQQ